MKKKRIILLFIIITGISVQSLAQISGRVIDASSQSIIRDASILITTTQFGATTNRNGQFQLDWTTFPIRIRVSAIGYETKEIQVFQTTSNLQIELSPTIYRTEEIFVSEDRINTTNIRSRPIPVTSISTNSSKIQMNTSAVDLLRSEKGVYVQQTTPGQGSVYIRGRAGRDVLYLYNGLRINPSFVRSGQNQYFGAIDALSMSQINVMRGPVSVYYGSDALSGGVNVLPYVAEYRDSLAVSGRITAIGNFFGTGERSTNLKANVHSPRLAVHLSGTYREFQFYRMSPDSRSDIWFPYSTRMEIANYDFKAYLASARYRIDGNNQLEVTSYTGYLPDAARIDQMIIGYARQVDPNITQPTYGYASNTSPLQLSTHSIRWKYATPYRLFNSLNVVAGYHHLKDHRKESPYVNPASSQPTIMVTDYDKSTSNMYLMSFDLTSIPSPSTIVRFGGDLSVDNVSGSRYRSHGTTISIPLLPRYPDGSRYIQSGLFSHITYNLSSRIWIEGGLRYSYIHADLNLEGVESDRGFNAYDTQFKFTTGSLGLSWSPTPGLYLLTNFSTGFRAPNVADLSELGIRRSRFIQVPNPALSGEKTVNTDLSLRWIRNEVRAEVTGYMVQYFDKIESVQTGRTVLSGSSGNERLLLEIMNRNEDKMRLYGVESSLDVSPDKWTGGFVLNYTFGELHKRNGDVVPVDRIPPLNGYVYAGYELPGEILLTARIRYAGAQRRLSELELQDYRISNDGTDAFWVLQVMAGWQIGTHSEFRVIADNLTDRAYREHGSTLDGLGRNITLRYAYNF